LVPTHTRSAHSTHIFATPETHCSPTPRLTSTHTCKPNRDSQHDLAAALRLNKRANKDDACISSCLAARPSRQVEARNRRRRAIRRNRMRARARTRTRTHTHGAAHPTEDDCQQLCNTERPPTHPCLAREEPRTRGPPTRTARTPSFRGAHRGARGSDNGAPNETCP
jgi:hypothetical protein